MSEAAGGGGSTVRPLDRRDPAISHDGSGLVVILLPESPYPPMAGNALRDVQQIQVLGNLGCRVRLLCVRPRLGASAAEDMERAAAAGVEMEILFDAGRDSHESLYARTRRKIAYLRAKNGANPFAWWYLPYALAHVVPERVARIAPDILVVRSLFLDLLPSLRQTFPGRIVVDCHDADVHLAREMVRSVPWWRRPGPFANYRGVRTVCRKALPLADEIWAVSKEDVQRIRPFAGDVPILAVASAVDPAAIVERAAPGADDVCALVANYSYGPNLNGARWLVERVWPLVRRRRLRARLLLVGGGADRELRRLAAPADGVDVLGRVDDLGSIYRHAGVMLAPLIEGSGTRLKIIEAWKHGKAVLTTSKGIEGICRPPTVAAVKDDPAAFAHTLAELLGDRRQRLQLGDAGRQFVREHLSYASAEQVLATQSVVKRELRL